MASSSSKTEAAALALPERIQVGVLRRPHGLRGEIDVEVTSDHPARFACGSELLVAGSARRLTVERSAAAHRGLRVAFAEVTTREQAEELRGARLEVPRAAVPPAAAGEYYFFELVGCRAFDERAGEVGSVVDVVDGAAGLLLVVERPDGARVPLPFVERFLVGVDRARRRIDWRLPEGLIESCTSRS